MIPGRSILFLILTAWPLAAISAATPADDYNRMAAQAAGYGPDGAIVRSADGTIYGTTQWGGGPENAGAVFEVKPDGTVRALVTFTGANGGNPIGGLVQTANGDLWGVTQYANSQIFRINPADRVLHLVARFDQGTIGIYPGAGLTLASDGNLYGATSAGGAAQGGTIFRVTPAGEVTPIALLSDMTGRWLKCRLLEAPDGSFYGATQKGGANNAGTIFRVTKAGALTVLASFVPHTSGAAEGPNPVGDLVLDAAGNLLGVTSSGTIYKLTPVGVLSTVFLFDGTRGAYPLAGLVAAGDGSFYGSTAHGGDGNYGAFYHLLADGTVTRVYSGNFYLGEQPRGELLPAGDGSYVTTTYEGGVHHDGAVVRLTVDGTLANIGSFERPTQTLLNISTRGRVEPGDHALIAGFIVRGDPKRVIVIARGLSLPRGAGGAAASLDPTLELRNAAGQLLRSNDNWREQQEAAIAATVCPGGRGCGDHRRSRAGGLHGRCPAGARPLRDRAARGLRSGYRKRNPRWRISARADSSGPVTTF